MNPVTHPRLLFFLLLLAGFATTSYSHSYPGNRPGTVCELSITNVTTTNETCPGANDGTLTVEATCPSCSGGNADIRYSIDNIDFSNTTGVFNGLAPGSYTVYVRDVNEVDCVDSDGGHIVNAGIDNEAPFPDAGGDWVEEVKVLASDGTTFSRFGYSVSIFGNYAIVGAERDDDNGLESGSAYILHRSGNTWIEQAKLTAADGATNDRFGYSVSISGDYVIVGAYLNDDDGSNSGSAYIFHRNGSTWTQQAKLTADDAAANDEFGCSVSISGDYAIVGSRRDNVNGSNSGSAYIFHRSGSTWTQMEKLAADDAAANDRFGSSVSIDGDYAIVGAHLDDDDGMDSGSAYIFQRIGSTWTQQVKLTADDSAANDRFGSSVSIDGDYTIVGAPDHSDGMNSGSAYIFQRSGSTWTQQAKLTVDNDNENEQFGYSVSISGDYAIIGAHANEDNDFLSGAAFTFQRSGSNWTQQSKLTASDGAVLDYFGYSVAISGDYALVGAHGKKDNGTFSGSAYFFGRMLGELPAFFAVCNATPSTPTATDNCTGTIIGTTTTMFPITTQGTTTITWTYDDGNGNITLQDQDVVLEDVTAPVAICPTIAPTVVLDGSGNGTLAADALADGNSTDNCVAEPLETSPVTNFTCADAPSATVLLTATDEAGNTNSTNCTVNIDDSNCPCIMIIDVIITDETCPGSHDGTLTVTAFCGTCANGSTDIRYSIDSIDFSNTTGVFDELAPGVYKAFARNENDIDCIAISGLLTIVAGVDNELPVPDVSSENLPPFVVECNATPPLPTATDNCAGIIIGTTTAVFPITAPDTTTITWIYDDGNGNIAIQEQDIVILGDMTAPVAICPTVAPTFVLDGSGTGTLAANVLAGGNSTDNCSATLLETSPATYITCADAPLTTVLLTATDEAGNTNTTSCAVNIDDSNCPCITIIGVNTIGETCPDSNDGTLSVNAFCGSCIGGNSDIRYSIDNSDFSNSTGVFTGLAPGAYTVYVRDVNDIDCTNSGGPHIVDVGMDNEPPLPDVATIAGDWTEVAQVLTNDGAEGDEFGYSVSIDGDYAIVGAHRDNDNGSISGSAYVFRRSSDTWVQQAKLTANDGSSIDFFGQSVSISGNYIIVGAPFGDNADTSNTGSAYIFHRNGNTWAQQAKLIADDGEPLDYFGYSVSINEDYAIVGAYANDSNSGSAYIFHRDGNLWTQQAKLTPSDAEENDEFGNSVSINGEYAVIGAHKKGDNGMDSGAAYIFHRSGSIWTQQSKLTADDAAANDRFGHSVSIDGEYAIVGAYRDEDYGEFSGSAYMYHRSGTNWSQQTKLTASDGEALDYFGYSVSINKDFALVGAYRDDGNTYAAGSAYLFYHSNGTWTQLEKLMASDGAGLDYFGYSVSISGNFAAIGAHWDDDNGNNSGSAYIFNGKTSGDLPAITAGCSVTPPTPTATDNCTGTILGTTMTSFPITSLGSTTIIWMFDDGNGNVATQEQQIFLEDVTDPVAVCPTIAPTVVLDVNGHGTLPANALAGGNSTDNCTATPVETSPMKSFTCIDAPTAIVVLTATDEAGNSSSTNCTVNINYNNCPCVFITDVTTTNETCPGANDGTLTVTALCSTCISGNADIRYSIDNIDFSNTLGVFSGLAPGSYTVYVRDVNDVGCTNSDEAHIIETGVDAEAPVPDIASVGGWEEISKTLADDGDTDDEFGTSVSISGNYAIVGAYLDDDNGSGSGSAYVFHRSGSTWTQQAKLTADDGAFGDRFGFTVSLSGDYAILGAYRDDDNGFSSGSAYVFHRSGNTWTQQAKLTADDGTTNDRFGYSVSISGNYAIVGAFYDDDNGFNSGSAYVFHRSGSSWTQQAKLTADDGETGDEFGHSVSIHGDYAIVGNYLDDDNGISSGSAYIFHRSGNNWTQQAKLTANDGSMNDWFGYSVSINSVYAIIGAYRDSKNGPDSGSTYIFQRNGDTWTQQTKLTANTNSQSDRFGHSVSIGDDYAVVGAHEDDDNGFKSGAVYIYKRTGSTWVQDAKLAASDATVLDHFGTSVSISGNRAIAGAPLDDDNGSESGSAYFFELAPDGLPPFTAECSATPPTPTATDNCNGTITGTTTATFPITTTGTITWTYDDGNGNITTQEQDILVEDMDEPTITCPSDTTVQATSPAGALVTFADAIATDNCSATVTQTQGAASGSTFAAGLHIIVFEATDEASNTASCSFTIEVEPLVSVFNVGANGPIKLYQNIPNPFDEATRIGFELPEATEVKLRITDVSGREIQLIEGRYAAGYHEVEVRDLPARGLFFYQLQTEGFTATLKMVRE